LDGFKKYPMGALISTVAIVAIIQEETHYQKLCEFCTVNQEGQADENEGV
jgi:hypothetical protein